MIPERSNTVEVVQFEENDEVVEMEIDDGGAAAKEFASDGETPSEKDENSGVSESEEETDAPTDVDKLSERELPEENPPVEPVAGPSNISNKGNNHNKSSVKARLDNNEQHPVGNERYYGKAGNAGTKTTESSER